MKVLDGLKQGLFVLFYILFVGCSGSGVDTELIDNPPIPGVNDPVASSAKLSIENAAAGTGSAFNTHTMRAGEQITLYAVLRDKSTGEFINNVNVTWSIKNSNGVLSQQSTSYNTFTASKLGTEVISVNHAIYGTVSTSEISLSPGVATKFVLSNPSDTTVGNVSTVTVTAFDAYDNVVTDYQGDVTLTTGGSASVSGGVSLIDIVNGVGSVSVTNTVAETVTLGLSDTQSSGLDVSSSQDLIFDNGPAHHFTLVDPADSLVGSSTTVTVRVEDVYNNLVDDYQNDVSVTLSGSATGAGVVDIVNGLGSLSINDGSAETVAIGLVDSHSTGLNISSAQNVVFSIGAVASFVILEPSDTTAGTSATITVRAVDLGGNKVPTYNNDVTLTVNGSATIVGGNSLVDIINGEGTLNVTDTHAETVVLGLSDSQATGLDVASSKDIVFSAAAASKFVVIDPSDVLAGSNATVTIEAQDSFGNKDTAYNNDVSVTLTGSASVVGGSALVNITNGTGNIQITDAVVEAVTIGLSDTQGTGLNVASNQSINFTSASVANKIVVLDPTDKTVGNSATITIQVQDAGSSVVSGWGGSVTLTASGSATGAGVVTITNGQGSIVINDTKAETVILGLIDSGSTGLTLVGQNIVFSPANATQFIVVNPTDVTAGGSASVTVQALDTYNNIDTNFNSDVTLTANGSAVINGGSPLVDIVNGIGTISVSNNVAETVTLGLSDTQSTGLTVTSTQDVIFSPAVAIKFVVFDPSDTTAGNNTTVTVKALDSNNNVDTNYNNDVTLTVSGTASIVGGNALVDIANGVGSLQVTNTKAETVSLGLSDTQSTGLSLVSGQNVVFGPASATQFDIVNPTDVAAGSSSTVTVRALDTYGNIDTNYQSDVTLTANGSASINGGSPLVDISNGVGTISITDTVAETVSLGLSDTQSTGLAVSDVEDIIFNPGVAIKFVVLDPSDSTAGTSTNVIVQALDVNNNIDTSFQNDVTLTASGNAVVNSGTALVNIVNGAATVPVNDLTAESVTLGLSDTQSTGLNISSTQIVVFASGPATQFVLLNPTDTSTGTNATVTVQAQDANGNVDGNYNSDVSLTLSGSASVVGGNALVDIVSGVGTIQISNGVIETVTIGLSDTQSTGLAVTSTQDIIFSGVPAKFVILNPTGTTVGQNASITIEVQDASNNLVATYQNDVTLDLSGSATATGGGVVDIVNGTATVAITDTKVGTVSLSLSDSQSTGLDVSSSQNVSFSAGSAVSFVVLDPLDSSINNATTVTVQAQDSYGNVDTTYNLDVHLSASGSATVSNSGNVDIVSGSGSLSVNDAISETVTLSLTDTGGTGLNVGSTQTVFFSATTPTKIVIKSLSSYQYNVGTSVNLVLEVQGADGTLASSYQNDVTLNVTGSATGAGLVDIVNGTATIVLTDTVAETVFFSLSDTQSTGLDVSSTKSIQFIPATGTKLVFVVASSTYHTNETYNLCIQAQDQYGNIDEKNYVSIYYRENLNSVDTDILAGIAGQYCLIKTYTTAGVVTYSFPNAYGSYDTTSTAVVTIDDSALTKQYYLTRTSSSSMNGISGINAGETDILQITARDATYAKDTSVTGYTMGVTDDIGTAEITGAITNGLSADLSFPDRLPQTIAYNVTTAPNLGAGNYDNWGAGFSSAYKSPTGIDRLKFKLLDNKENTSATSDTEIAIAIVAENSDGDYGNGVTGTVTITHNGSNLVHQKGTCGGKSEPVCPTDMLVTLVDGVGFIALSSNTAQTITLGLSSPTGFISSFDMSDTLSIEFYDATSNEVLIDEIVQLTQDAKKYRVKLAVRDAAGTLVTTENGTVDLATTGSATGGGTVNFVNGVGTAVLENTVSEIIDISLSNPSNTSLAAKDSRKLSFIYHGNKSCLIYPCPYLTNTSVPTDYVQTSYTLESGTSAIHNEDSIVVEDFDKDGNYDFAHMTYSSTDRSSYLTIYSVSSTTGAVDTTPWLKLLVVSDQGSDPNYEMKTIDANQDGYLDLIIRTNGIDMLLYINNGDRTFAPPVGLIGNKVYWKTMELGAIADVNGDGIADIVAMLTNTRSNLLVLKGKGDGTFAVQFMNINGSARHMMFYDFNGDHKPDYCSKVTTTVSCSVANSAGMTNKDGATVLGGNYYVSTGMSSTSEMFEVLDINQDGFMDVMWNYSNALVSRWGSEGTSLSAATNMAMDLDGSSGNLVVDYDNNGYPDIIYTKVSKMYLLANKSDGGATADAFISETQISSGTAVVRSSSVPIDLNFDGKVDFITVNTLSALVSLAQ